jgi:hypothetical protein
MRHEEMKSEQSSPRVWLVSFPPHAILAREEDPASEGIGNDQTRSSFAQLHTKTRQSTSCHLLSTTDSFCIYILTVISHCSFVEVALEDSQNEYYRQEISIHRDSGEHRHAAEGESALQPLGTSPGLHCILLKYTPMHARMHECMHR